MEIMKGTSRTVVRVGNVVFKFPQYVLFAQRLWKSRKYPVQRKVFTILFLNGIVANITEFGTWINLRSSFLAPTYFSIGFFSIQKYIEGTKPTMDELHYTFTELSENAKYVKQWVSGHAFDPPNFRKTPSGIVMLDYGEAMGSDPGSLTAFLWKHYVELNQVLRNYKTPPTN